METMRARGRELSVGWHRGLARVASGQWTASSRGGVEPRSHASDTPRLAGKEGSGRCPACGLTIQLRRDGAIVSHKTKGAQCAGTGEKPAEPVPVASWLPLRTGLTPHGLRHGHQTWLDDMGVRYVLQSERMGHEVPGMRGVYSHITPGMRAGLKAGLQELWERSLHERSRLAPRSAVAVLDGLLAPYRDTYSKIGSRFAPKIGHQAERGQRDDDSS